MIPWISLFLIVLVSLAVIVTSVKRIPDLGMLFALIVIGLTVWRRPGDLDQLGLRGLENWAQTILLCLLLGSLVSFLSAVTLEPLVERWTGQEIDLRIMDPVRGNRKALWQMLALVWILVALLEEVVFRGFLMTEMARLFGTGNAALLANLLLSSALFGLAHWYQGVNGVILTGVVGLLLGGVFIQSGFNLLPPVFLHGFIDTASLILLYFNLDRRLKTLVFKASTQGHSESNQASLPSEHPHE